ncbi:MAG: bis(5'-nucleosyl)-tetraphosphatase (symmetrical) [Cellvibrionaceae bacterium]|jgi:bis(5'-nucleosyl)-tetraphosphatase (symmetrical)
MATYAVGDIQGCLDPLQTLLTQVSFKPGRDKLWVVGDIVNRGPKSLETLRFLFHLRDSLVIVLGNHDLHLLAVAAGYRRHGSSDTLENILRAPDRDVLLEWLRQQALLHHDPQLNYTMVHAGIPPQWSLKEAISHADEVTEVLRSANVDQYLKHLYGREPDIWDESLTGPARWRLITNYFTQMRFCSAEGRLELKTKTDAEAEPEGYRPWFAHKNRLARGERIIFGHWAALDGNANHENIYAIDTGFVWGRKLTMMSLDTQTFFSVGN